jgi:ABC-2 type transport system ATP-binding protein
MTPMEESTNGPGQADAAIEIRGLSKTFSDFWRRPKITAVAGLNMSVLRGEVFGLLGPNGSGKSTTIRLILGLLHPTAGEVSILGKRPDDVRVKASIGYLPEESHLYHYLSPRETLDFYGRLFDLGTTERRRRTEQLLDMVGLRHAADRPVGEFSKGMARRIGLAQALINDPMLLILDEPTSGLDPLGCRQVKDLMLTLAKRGKTILLCSHLLADVEDVCNRIAILYNGRIRAMGSVRELLREQNRLRLTMPLLSPEQTRNLIDTLRTQFGDPIETDQPSIGLERFFLEVVERATDGREADSGVGKAAGVAEYLSDTARRDAKSIAADAPGGGGKSEPC